MTTGTGRITWAIKESLLDYLHADPELGVELADGATFDSVRGASLPCVVRGDGTVEATGSVVLTALGGSLTVALRGVVISRGRLVTADPLGGPGDRRALVDLRRTSPPDPDPRVTRYEARLSPEAAVLFAFRYPPSTRFADLALVPDDAATVRIP
ncbi:MAG: hypothetical protein J0G30_01675 [Actinomycetales bacterium]|nr:hypothetical protein [Actinomycetales bacterium]